MLNNITEFWMEYISDDGKSCAYTQVGKLIFPTNRMVRFSMQKNRRDEDYDDNFECRVAEKEGKYYLVCDFYETQQGEDGECLLRKVREDKNEIVFEYDDDEGKIVLHGDLG